MVRAYVPICVAKKCYNTRISHPDKEFFGFPSDISQCSKWLKECGRADLDAKTVCNSKGYYKLCSDHFEDKWFTDGSRSLLNRSLNPVPTRFVNNITTLLPKGSQSKSPANIDLPLETDENPLNLCECVLDPAELSVENKQQPISYHSNQMLKKNEYDPTTISKALLNLNPETKLDKIDELCRLCVVKPPGTFVDMFAQSDDATSVRAMYNVVMPKKMDVCDGLPHKVCQKCLAKLKTCHGLVEQFKKADRYLRAVAKFSLFLEEEEDGRSSEDDSISIHNDDFTKQIPKKAKIIPLKHLLPDSTETENFLTAYLPPEPTINTPEEDVEASTKSVGTETSEEYVNDNLEYESANADTQTTEPQPADSNSVTEVLQSLPVAIPELDLISAGQQLFQDVQLICSNVVMISDQIGDKEKPITPTCQNNTDISFINLDGIGKDKIDVSNSEKSYEVKNIYPLRNKSGATDSYLSISFKCLECSSVFSNYHSLREHVLSTHQNKKKPIVNPDDPVEYTCRFCDGKYRDIKRFRKHLKKDHQDSKVICAKCVKPFDNKVALIRHNRLEHALKCTKCEKTFYTRLQLEQHHHSAHQEKKECRYCGKQFKTVVIKRVHESKHSWSKEICWVCGLVVKNKKVLKDHMHIHDDKKYICDICGVIRNTPSLLSKHKRLHDPAFLVKKYMCHACPKTFLYKQGLQKHQVVHSSEYQFHCEKCGKGFSQKIGLLIHERHNVCERRGKRNADKKRVILSRGPFEVTETPQHECDVCGRKFIKLASVLRHKKYHFCNGNPEIIQKLLDEPEVHKCEVCGRHQFSKLSLQFHMRLHTGSDKPFHCEFCGNRYASRQQFVVHERTHTGEKPFKCSSCESSFYDGQSLKVHELSHGGKLPHKCQICGEAYKVKSQLTRHVTLKHMDDNGKYLNQPSYSQSNEVIKEYDEAMEEDEDFAVDEAVTIEHLSEPDMTEEIQNLDFIITPEEFVIT